eukprot:1433724-Rhodomonas_salina.2
MLTEKALKGMREPNRTLFGYPGTRVCRRLELGRTGSNFAISSNFRHKKFFANRANSVLEESKNPGGLPQTERRKRKIVTPHLAPGSQHAAAA